MTSSRLIKTCVLSVLVTLSSVCSQSVVAQEYSDIYPVGAKMPLGLYGLTKWTRPEVAAEKDGWNISQTYKYSSSFPGECDRAGIGFTAILNAARRWNGTQAPPTLSRTLKQINELKKYDKNIWWEFPEELRPFIGGELRSLAYYSKLTQELDPLHRPRYMYIPSQYSTEVIAKLVPHLDIIPVSLYRYGYRPPQWVRWRIESAAEGIRNAGASQGPNYRNGQKTLIAVLELFKHYYNQKIPNSREAYHDFWQALTSGAQGIMVFSHHRITDDKRLKPIWDEYAKAVRELTENKLDDVLLWGRKENDAHVEVIAGAERTGKFGAPWKNSPKILDFSSINIREVTYRGIRYLFMVNSVPSNVSIRLTNLRNANWKAEELLSKNVYTIEDHSLNQHFGPYEVRVLKFTE